MDSCRSTFTNPHVLLVVIHVESGDQAIEQAGIAHKAGADGVFLINHALVVSYGQLIDIYKLVRAQFPDLWIGLNFLDLEPASAFAVVPASADGLLVGDAGITEGTALGLQARRIAVTRRISCWSGLYFGGVAHKGGRKVEDVGAVARAAMRYMDVITTSGPATGIAADPAKLRAMREAIGDHPLALASGVTAGNIEQYFPYADFFLVASSVSRDFAHLDPGLLQELVEIVRRQNEFELAQEGS